MKKAILGFCLLLVCMLSTRSSSAQAKELAQLALNIEKLAQFKQILSDLKKTYAILTTGYNTIKNISEGNFKLHQVFLDGLMEVNPAIKKYKKVADIVNYQVLLIKEYKTAFQRSKESGLFTLDEIDYMGKVYSRLFDASVNSLDDLFTVITASKLRMSDDERIAAIDRIYEDMEDKLTFLRYFNNSNAVLSFQRAKEQKDISQMKGWEGIK